MKQVNIFVDANEPRSMKNNLKIQQADSRFLGLININVVEESLRPGDFTNKINIAGERKKYADLYSSRNDGRYELQTPELLEAFERGLTPYLILEGRLKDLYLHPHIKTKAQFERAEKVIEGMLFRYATNGICVIPTKNQYQTATMIVRLCWEGPQEIYHAKPARVIRTREPALKQAFRLIKGIGEDAAGRLYEEFPTGPDFFAATVQEIARVLSPKSGRSKKAQMVYDVWR